MKRARELDGQGVRAFKDGRFKDAIIFFEEAYRNGAPPVELWNIAKCHIKLDEPEQAEDAFHAYLEQPDLTAQDRADATQELGELRSRPSTLAIDSDPSGATFTIDGSTTTHGTTPGSIDVPPGTHHVHVSKEGAGTYDVDVDARLGRALIVRAKLGEKSGGIVSASPTEPPPDPDRDRVGLVFSEDFGFFAPNLGGYGDSIRPVLHLAARYVIAHAGAAAFSLGLRFSAGTDGWHTSGVPTVPASGASTLACNAGPDYSAVELAGFFVAGFTVQVHSRILLGADIGLGASDLEGAPAGGDVFAPDCNPSYGLRPAFHFGTEMSFILTKPGPFRARVLVEPILFQAHGAYAGAITGADGLWWRIGPAVGFALDF
ncbi:MAG TPA: PEGA domain-containing protein [Polyangiaceae bacterium]